MILSLRQVFLTTANACCFIFLLIPIAANGAEYSFLERDEDSGQVSFPAGDVFTPLIAALKQPQFFVSFINIESENEDIHGASVGIGHTFGLFRWSGEKPGDGWQLSFFGGVFSLFNMDSSSDDLINTDYLVGFPLTYRHGSYSVRFRLYHQSSHLGDELLLGDQAPERVNLSVDVVDALLSYEWRKWRGYGGVTYILRHDPSDLKQLGAQLGVEYRTPIKALWANQLLGGLDIKSYEEVDWDSSISLKLGLAYGRQSQGGSGIRLMLEAYDGPSPFGQFFNHDLTYYGLGMYFDY